MPTAQVVKWGNSLAIRIPKLVAEEAGVSEGDPIELEAERGEIKLRRREKIPTLRQLVSQITPENRHGETLTGSEVGKETAEW
jgi:antitoxin MazE